jgi:hypothetical protein
VGLPAEHVRHQLGKIDIEEGVEQEIDNGDEAAWEQKAVSTMGLLALLSKWSCGNRRLGFSHEDDVAAARGLLHVLLKIAFQKWPNVLITIVSEGHWSEGAFAPGARTCILPISEGSIDLRGALRRFPDELKTLRTACPAGQASLVDVLGWACVRPGLHWFFKQLVWELGLLVDPCLQAMVAQSLDTQNVGDEEGRMAMEMSLTRYVVGGRKGFVLCKNLSLSLDASRVGQKDVFVGVIANSDNHAMAVPPQVAS